MTFFLFVNIFLRIPALPPSVFCYSFSVALAIVFTTFSSFSAHLITELKWNAPTGSLFKNIFCFNEVHGRHETKKSADSNAVDAWRKNIEVAWEKFRHEWFWINLLFNLLGIRDCECVVRPLEWPHREFSRYSFREINSFVGRILSIQKNYAFFTELNSKIPNYSFNTIFNIFLSHFSLFFSFFFSRFVNIFSAWKFEFHGIVSGFAGAVLNLRT